MQNEFINEFNNKIVLVTGSSRGIGKKIAEEFLKAGAKVMINGAKDKEGLVNTYEEFKNQGYKCEQFLGDISQREICENLFSYITEKFGYNPDIVINNAGIAHSTLFTDTNFELWNKIITTNLNSAYNCAHLATPNMISKHEGVIINITSIWGEAGASCEVAYSTSKSAINGFTKALAKELGPSNIRVNAISCGWVDTSMNDCYTEEDKEAFIEEIPLCRVGIVDDIANTCLFLASNKASYMTAQIVRVDGGYL